jgi:hypothetical protein
MMAYTGEAAGIIFTKASNIQYSAFFGTTTSPDADSYNSTVETATFISST